MLQTSLDRFRAHHVFVLRTATLHSRYHSTLHGCWSIDPCSERLLFFRLEAQKPYIERHRQHALCAFVAPLLSRMHPEDAHEGALRRERKERRLFFLDCWRPSTSSLYSLLFLSALNLALGTEEDSKPK